MSGHGRHCHMADTDNITPSILDRLMRIMQYEAHMYATRHTDVNYYYFRHADYIR